jgi:pyruvate ferredoxin oxidoreductase beta subunit
MNPRTQDVKFYQVGSFAIGNRLVEPDQRSAQSDARRANTLIAGHRACQGCGEVLGARYVLDAAMRATGGKLIAVNATGCLEVVSTPYPESAWRVPWLHSLFGNAPAVASGVAAALKAQGHADVRVLGQAGDGGAVDIGFGALSGMFERDDDVLFVCYDNQAYMNTGVQRSGATPGAARTATTPVTAGHPGNGFGQGKDVPAIAMAHRIPYTATATVADLRDLEAKVERAMQFTGARYLHVLVPCPLGWGAASSQTVRLARLAVESGLFPLFEAEYGEVTAVTPIRRPVPVDDYLRAQNRYAHLFDEDGSHGGGRPDIVARIQAGAERNIVRYGLRTDLDQSDRGRLDPDEGGRP